MNILLLHTQGAGVADYRHYIPGHALRRRGHDVWMREDAGSALDGKDADAFLMEKAAWADVIHVGMASDNNLTSLLCAVRNYAAKVLHKNLPIIVDSDDDILHVPSYNMAYKGYTGSGEFRKGVLWQFRCADALTVTMPALAEHYANRNANVTVLPNCVDIAAWEQHPLYPRTDRRDVRIMFAGGVSRLNDVDTIRPALESVMRQRPQARLFFMGMLPKWAADEWMPDTRNAAANRCFFIYPGNVTNYRRVVRYLAPDIMLAPVEANEFNRSKSALKTWEGALAGAATVCTDWDTYAEVPNDVVLKCSTEYEWRESLLALIDDVDLRRRKAARCLQWTRDEKGIDKHIALWENTYEAALSRPVIGDDGENMLDVPDSAPSAPLVTLT